MLGVSFSEIFVLALVSLLVVGPKNLPQALGTMGKWVAKLRRIGTEVRYQIGVDDMLRQEGLQGGINELRSLMRGGLAGGIANAITQPSMSPQRVNYQALTSGDSKDVADDRSREYPPEGPDAYGAIPDDLLPETETTSSAASTAAPAITAAASITATAVGTTAAPTAQAVPRPVSVPPPPPSSRGKTNA